MKAELTLPEELVEQLADRLTERLKPVLAGNVKRPDDEVIFDVHGLAEYLKVDASWVYKKVSLKEIPHFHAGKYPRFKKSQIDKWIESQTVRPLPPLGLSKKARESP